MGAKTPSVLHIFPQDIKFAVPFIAFVKKNFDIAKHRFLFLSPEGYEDASGREHIEVLRSKTDIFKYISAFYKAEKIILHSILSSKLMIFLMLQPWLLKKCYWVIWGRDLYQYQTAKKDFNEWCRAFVIKRLGHIVTFLEGDFKRAQKWYKTRAQYHSSFVYQSNVFKKIKATSEPHDGINILLGNSAHPENNHDRAFEILEPYKDQNVQIVTPLTYGKEEYAQSVIKQGRNTFGDQYKPLTDFMPFEEYVKFLSSIDIAVFAHDRQQAMGNIITLLGMGKTIYMNDNHTIWDRFTDIGIKFFKLNAFDLTLLSEEDRTRNQEIMREHFSEQSLLQSLKWMSA